MIEAPTSEALTEYRLDSTLEDAPPLGRATMTKSVVGLAVFDGSQWAALCPELDVASCGATSDEALDNLVSAVREAVEVAGVEAATSGPMVSDEDLREFLEQRQTNSVVGRSFVVPPVAPR
ncbi:MAG: hypothetical protein ACYCS9_05800 [Candidatus Dormibacteria bacterium]